MQQFEVDLGAHHKREQQQVVDFYDKNLVFFPLSLSIAEKICRHSHFNDDSFTVLLVNNEVRLRNLSVLLLFAIFWLILGLLCFAIA